MLLLPVRATYRRGPVSSRPLVVGSLTFAITVIVLPMNGSLSGGRRDRHQQSCPTR